MWCNISNIANAKTYGEGELKLSRYSVENFIKWIKGKNTEKPQNFYVTLDGSGTTSWTCQHSECTPNFSKETKDCEKRFGKACKLFATKRYIKWKNGINPGKGKVSKFSSEMTDAQIYAKLEELGFYKKTKLVLPIHKISWEHEERKANWIDMMTGGSEKYKTWADAISSKSAAYYSFGWDATNDGIKTSAKDSTKRCEEHRKKILYDFNEYDICIVYFLNGLPTSEEEKIKFANNFYGKKKASLAFENNPSLLEKSATKEKRLAEQKGTKKITWQVFVKLTGEMGNNSNLPGFNVKETSKIKTIKDQVKIVKKILDKALNKCENSNVKWTISLRGNKICTVTVVKYFDEENPKNNNKYVNLLGIKFDDLIITINGLENVTSEKIEDKASKDKAAKEKKLADAKAAKEKKLADAKITKEIKPKNLDKITSIEEAQTTVNNIQSTINMYVTINGVMAKQKNARKNTYKEIIEKKIATLRKQKELLQTMLTTRFSTPIKPSNANLNVSAFRSAETFPKIPFYIPGTNEIGEMLVTPRVSDDGYLLYKLDFLDPTSEYDKVRDSIKILHENIESVISGLQKIDEWTVVAQKNKLNRRISKTSICVPSDACKTKKKGVTSTEIIFQVYEDGSTSGRIQRNKGLFSIGYNLSVESTILMSSYLVYMQEVGAQEFKSGSMSDEQVESLFN